MTIEQALINRLVKNGLFENQANEVMHLVKNHKANIKMTDRWDDDVNNYPDMLFNILWVTTREIALEYINTNIPNAWYKILFED